MIAQKVLDIIEDNTVVNKLTFISTSLAFFVIGIKTGNSNYCTL